MDVELRIGELEGNLEKSAIVALGKLKADGVIKWRQAGEDITISLLNLASVCCFLDHVAKLEGFPDSETALDKTRFRNLPWWQTSIWLPLVFRPPQELAIESEELPVFLGSSQGLLSDLDEVQRLSGLDLGKKPDGYDRMRMDLSAFRRSDFVSADESSVVRWVWLGLRDGAEISLRRSSPLLTG